METDTLVRLRIVGAPSTRAMKQNDFSAVAKIIISRYAEAGQKLNINLDPYAVTLLGSIAQSLKDEYPDGRYFVIDAPLSGGETNVIGVVGYSRTIDARLLKYVRDLSGVIPNFEKMLEAGEIVQFRSIYTDPRLTKDKEDKNYHVGTTLLDLVENSARTAGFKMALFFSNQAWQKAHNMYTGRGYSRLGTINPAFANTQLFPSPPGDAYMVDLTASPFLLKNTQR